MKTGTAKVAAISAPSDRYLKYLFMELLPSNKLDLILTYFMLIINRL